MNVTMLDVLVAIEIVEWTAKNAHYRSNDECFYALHLLADKVDFGSAEDDLKEAYFLGQKETTPPTETEIHTAALKKFNAETPATNRELVQRLYDACSNLAYIIEEQKREPGLMAGIHAILDGVSQMALTIKGLCWRTLNG